MTTLVLKLILLVIVILLLIAIVISILVVVVIVAVEVLVMGSAFFRAALAKVRTGKTTIDNADRGGPYRYTWCWAAIDYWGDGEKQPPKKL